MISDFFKLSHFSLRGQLIYGIGLFLSLLLSIFIYTQLNYNNNFTRSKELQQASNHSLALASMVKVWVMSNDYIGLEEALENFSVYDNLTFATVINMDGKIIAHTDKSLIGHYIADEERISFLRNDHIYKENILKIIRNGYNIDVMRYVYNKGKHIGSVHLRFNMYTIEKQILSSIYQSIGFGFLFLLVSILILYLIVNKLTMGLESLVNTIKKVHRGDKKTRASIEGATELSMLANEFNNMLDSIGSGEHQLKETKEQLEYAVNGTQDGLWDWDLETNYIYFSPRWKEMLGYKDDELENELKSWESNVHPDDINKAKRDVAFSQEKKGNFYENIHRLKHKDGSWIWILARGQTIFNDKGKAVRMLGFNTDITKQKQLENEILEQEELIIAQSRQAAMGEMIGMIAHQWRQPITVISMGANNILVDIDLNEANEDSFKQEASNILEQTEYLSKTIDDFRNFFRPNKEKDKVKVQDVILEAKQIMGKSLEYHNVTLSIEESDAKPIVTYSRELLQVLLNIFKNSKEAIDLRNIKDGYINVNIEDIKDRVAINICDNGGGIPDEIIKKIYEPYFSTKGKKTGTGLGLYMSQTIINKHLKGTIKATNTNDGVCFKITIKKENNV